MKNIIIAIFVALTVGIFIGAKVFHKDVVVNSGQVTYTQSQLDSIKTSIIDSTAKTGKVTNVTRTIVVSGKGKIDTVETVKVDTLNYEEFLRSTIALQETSERESQLYMQYMDSLKAHNPATNNINIGLVAGAGYGLKSKDIAPIIAMPIRYRHVVFMPFAEYAKEVRAGASVGLTF